MKLKLFLITSVILILGVGLGLLLWQQFSQSTSKILSPLVALKAKPEPTPKPLEKYSFENLRKREGKASEIKLERELSKGSASAKASADKRAFTASNAAFASYLFSFLSEGRKITGLANLPEKSAKLPVIIMIRGYVEQKDYQTGVGTQRAGEYFAQHGFITLAPDFLGYGESDMPPNNVWEERFLRLTTVMDLLASIGPSTTFRADPDKIGIWGHSNGGLLALSVLEITAGNYPTSLWAPVSQYFPYDILYYTYEFEDKGRALRYSLAEFEKDYDVNQYSLDEYLDWIKAPIILHQGTNDAYIPRSWSNDLSAKLKELDKDVVYYTYPGADHNLSGVWNTVVARDLNFFQDRLE